jgi:hypothetical protein
MNLDEDDPIKTEDIENNYLNVGKYFGKNKRSTIKLIKAFKFLWNNKVPFQINSK